MAKLHLSHRLGLIGGLGISSVVVTACFNDPSTARLGYEVEDIKCQNNFDDDYDGLIDCEDPDCIFTSSLCGEDIPQGLAGQEREDTFIECTDRIDNDGNGQFDCGTDSCRGIPEVCCLREFDNESCSDGIDNDGNNFADCADFGCRTGIFVTVCDEQGGDGSCSDGVDNDNDGLIDCADGGCDGDPDCSDCPPGSDCFGPELCADEIDNDDDGFTDCFDVDCLNELVCVGAGAMDENTVDTCTDGIDNDGNGFVDCDDFSCSRSDDQRVVDACGALIEGDQIEECINGIDDDGDGFVDCNDFSCRDSDNAEVAQVCLAIREATFEECSDGIDNDQDGEPDCADSDCSRPVESPFIDGLIVNQASVDRCAPFQEDTLEKCTDGEDNDGNGFVDCGDFSCRISEDPIVQAACQESIGATSFEVDQRCSDGIDNDADGFVDCDDWDCSWNPKTTVCQAPGSRVCE